MTLIRSLKHSLRKYVWGDYPYAADVPARIYHRQVWAQRILPMAETVIYTAHNPMAPLGAAQFIGRQFEKRPVLFLVTLTWSTRSPNIIRRLAAIVDIYRHRRPEHQFLFLCNDPEEAQLLSRAGLATVACNHNALVDETVFRDMRRQAPRFRAVYNGAMIPWKRHALAELVPGCAFVYYRNSDISMEDALRYRETLKARMPGHTFINEIRDGAIVRISHQEIRDILSSSQVGLCLSAVEGAMKASIEYLLCGLPVVSTPSLGGRDQFAGEGYWLTVDDTPEAVRDGVSDMIRSAPSPEDIRAATIAKMLEHRERLRQAVGALTDGRVELPADLHDGAYRPQYTFRSGPELLTSLVQAH